MDLLRRKMKKLRRNFTLKKSALSSQGDKVVKLHRVKISEADIYQQSASASQRSIKNHVTEYKDRKSKELNDVVLMGCENSTRPIFGRPINNDIAIRFENIATTGLTNKQRKDLLEAHLPPVNCKLVDAPSLNSEVFKVITELDREQDHLISNKQKQICSAIACLGEAITLLLLEDKTNPTLRTLIMDSARILCDSQYNDSHNRRHYILASLKGDLKKQLKSTKINGMLFGKEVAQSTKTIEPKIKSENNLKVRISTELRKISNSKARSPNRTSISKEQMIHDQDHKKNKDRHEHKKIQDTNDNKSRHDHTINNLQVQRMIQNPSYRNSKRPIKDLIMVPLETGTSKSPRSSKQINRRDSQQRSRLPKLSKASTSSSHRGQ